MESKYNSLRRQLNDLGYSDSLSRECVPLVESLVADLLQTSKSLQQYMNTAKEALQQRDQLKCATEPYKCDNANLIKQNNKLNLELMQAKDECLNISRHSKFQIDKLQKQLETANEEIFKLKDLCRSTSLKNFCSETVSSRSKSVPVHERLCSASKFNTNKKSDKRSSDCLNCDNLLQDVDRLTVELTESKEANITYSQNIIYLKSQLALRDKEVSRLNRLVEYGRPSLPSNKQTCHSDLMKTVINLEKEVNDLNDKNGELEFQLKDSITKQHEAMKRAIQLADKNSLLEKELHNIDQLALKLEADCNKKLKEKSDYIASLMSRFDINKPTTSKTNEFQEDYFDKIESYVKELSSLKATLEENNNIKERLVSENKKLLDANRQLELLASNLADSEAIAQLKLKKVIEHSSNETNNNNCNCAAKITKEEILSILQDERKE